MLEKVISVVTIHSQRGLLLCFFVSLNEERFRGLASPLEQSLPRDEFIICSTSW